MGSPEVYRPAELVLTAAIARRYYLDGKSKIEIGEELRLSRFQVARLLERARSSGLVRIQVGGPGPVDLELSNRLQDAYGLQHAVVADLQTDDPTELRRQLGGVAAALLMEIVTAQDVLGLAWARAVSAACLAVTHLPPVPIVQLTGSMPGDDLDDSSVELVRRLAVVSGGPAAFFYAPMVLSSATTAADLRGQPEVARAFAHVDTVTIAMMGIGQWSSGDSTLYDVSSPLERRALTERGVCAEFCGVLVDRDGTRVETELTERMVAVSTEELRAIPNVVGVPYGHQKALAVRAALRSGIVTSLVTHSSLARAVLQDHC